MRKIFLIVAEPTKCIFLRHSYNYQPQRSRSSYGLGNMYGFASMGDVDWGRKRSAYDPWAYSSMADSDWGRDELYKNRYSRKTDSQ